MTVNCRKCADRKNQEASNPSVKIGKAPAVLGTFKYLMAWHPRMNTDAAHIWLRSIIHKTQVTDERAKLIFYNAFIDGALDAPRSLLPEVHRLYFEPEFPEFSARTMWSLSNEPHAINQAKPGNAQRGRTKPPTQRWETEATTEPHTRRMFLASAPSGVNLQKLTIFPACDP